VGFLARLLMLLGRIRHAEQNSRSREGIRGSWNQWNLVCWNRGFSSHIGYALDFVSGLKGIVWNPFPYEAGNGSAFDRFYRLADSVDRLEPRRIKVICPVGEVSLVAVG
jgi:hypothetical protein